MLEDHIKFAVLNVHAQQHIVPYINCLIALFMVLLLIYWRWSNRDCVHVCVHVYYRSIKTCAKRILSTFGRNVIIQWPLNYFVWNVARLCENIWPTTSYRWLKYTFTKALDIDNFMRCCVLFGTLCMAVESHTVLNSQCC